MGPNRLCSIDLREQVKVNPIHQSEVTERNFVYYSLTNRATISFQQSAVVLLVFQATIKKRKGNGTLLTHYRVLSQRTIQSGG